jgi:hypothetical protein
MLTGSSIILYGCQIFSLNLALRYLEAVFELLGKNENCIIGTELSVTMPDGSQFLYM